MIICQITDLHIKPRGQKAYGLVDTAAHLRACLDQIQNLSTPPDVIVATGDLVDAGLPEEYEHLGELLADLPMPVYLIPGNHDDRAALRFAFRAPRHAYLHNGRALIEYCVDAPPVRIIGMDSVVTGQAGGFLSEQSITWLEQTLDAGPGVPTVVLMHHPPFPTGIVHMDAMGLETSPRLEAVIRSHPQVERILCGHLHRAISVRFAGTIASSCQSSAHQVALDLRADGPAQFIMEPPGFQLHLWDEATGIVSHSACVGQFAGPFPFGDDDPAS